MQGSPSCGRQPLAAAGLLLALATIAGAVGAHVLSPHWSAVRMHVYTVAVRYQFYHSLGLLALGLLLRSDGPRAAGSQRPGLERSSLRLLRVAAWLIFAGIVLFSGSLYALTFGAPRWVGMVTPTGGAALIGGWLVFAYGIWHG